MITLAADRPSHLLAVRFATSPVWETAHAVRAYALERRTTTQRPWLDAVARSAAQLDLAPLLAVNPRAGYVPDFMTPPPRSPAPRLRDQLAEVRATPVAQVERELARVRASLADAEQRAIVDALLADPAAARDTLADLIDSAWRVLVAPFWPRIRALLARDVSYRSTRLAERGLRRVVDELHELIGWSGSAIAVDIGDELRIDLDERGVVLMPSAFVWPGVVVVTDRPWQPTIVYPARGIGALWQQPRNAPDALARLLGAGRAAVLASLDAPTSTTALAALLDLSASGVSRHLIALRDAGLASTSRHGHEVRYARTRLGSALLRQSDH